MTTSDYSLDDVQADVCHLAILLDLAVELAMEPALQPEDKHRQTLRLGTVLWVARDLAKRTETEIETNFAAIRGKAA